MEKIVRCTYFSKFGMMATIKVAFALLFIIMQVWANHSEIVQTTGGPIQGEILKTVSSNIAYQSFKGIRYGNPPLGYLRFKVGIFLRRMKCKYEIR